jgi:hypothetical protein
MRVLYLHWIVPLVVSSGVSPAELAQRLSDPEFIASSTSWTELGGPTSLRLALLHHDEEAVAATAMLAGELAMRGVSVDIFGTDFPKLCELIIRKLLTAGPSVFDHELFQDLRDEGLTVLEEFSNPATVLVYTPFANLHSVCLDLPLNIKSGNLIERIIRSMAKGSLDEFFSSSNRYLPKMHASDSMSSSLMKLLTVDPKFALVGFDVEYEDSTATGVAVARDWLGKLFMDILREYFAFDQGGEYLLIQGLVGMDNWDSPKHTSELRAIGRAFALALLMSLPVGAQFNDQILRAFVGDEHGEDEPELYAVVYGFREIISRNWLHGLFSSYELGRLFLGRRTVSAEEVVRDLVFSPPVPLPHSRWLVDFLLEDDERPMRFVQFVTGYARLPVGGLESLAYPLYVEFIPFDPTRPMPTAKMCSHTLYVPRYETEEILKLYMHEALAQDEIAEE